MSDQVQIKPCGCESRLAFTLTKPCATHATSQPTTAKELREQADRAWANGDKSLSTSLHARAANLGNDQPPPTPNEHPAVWDLVLQDMHARDEHGRRVYGTRLQPHNGRDPVRDAYEEILDTAVYLKQAQVERDRLLSEAGVEEWFVQNKIGADASCMDSHYIVRLFAAHLRSKMGIKP